jgi:dTDP-glucose 4,6-dehydratase
VTRLAVITGGAGFVGSHLAGRLLADGWRVLAVDNLLTGQAGNLPQQADLLRYDITQPLTLPGPVHAVLHLASPASPADYGRLQVETLRAGALGTLNALELARAHSARFLLASTSEVYGDPQVHPQPEDYWGHVNPTGPRAVYDEAKRYAEAATATYQRLGWVQTSIARIFNTYGPRMRPDDGRVVPQFIIAALQGQPLPIYGDGQQTRSLCYVTDLTEGLARLLHSGQPGPVNLGNPHEVTINQLALAIADLTGTQRWYDRHPLPEDDPRHRCPDISRAKALLGWKPHTTLEEGLQRTIDWYRQQP